MKCKIRTKTEALERTKQSLDKLEQQILLEKSKAMNNTEQVMKNNEQFMKNTGPIVKSKYFMKDSLEVRKIILSKYFIKDSQDCILDAQESHFGIQQSLDNHCERSISHFQKTNKIESVRTSSNKIDPVRSWSCTSSHDSNKIEPVRSCPWYFTEKQVTKELQKREGGTREYQVYCGRIDLITKTEIIEVKTAKHWKHAFGQIEAYSRYVPDKVKRVHLFRHANLSRQYKNEILQQAKARNIRVTFE